MWKVGRYAVTLLQGKEIEKHQSLWMKCLTRDLMKTQILIVFQWLLCPPPPQLTYQTRLCGTDATLVTETSVRWKICQLLMANSQQETLSLILCSLALFPYPLYPFSSSDSFPSFPLLMLWVISILFSRCNVYVFWLLLFLLLRYVFLLL